MMEYVMNGSTLVIRVSRGEDIVLAIQEACLSADVKTGYVLGIGACDHVVIGLYEVDKREYYTNTFDQALEMTSLMGNVTLMDGAYYSHLHATFADRESRAVAGHLYEARVSGTAEIFIQTLPKAIERSKDEVETGLNLFDFNK